MTSINLVAVIVAAVINMAVGFVWYNKNVFGRQWMHLMGKSEEELKRMHMNMGKTYGSMFVVSLIMAYILAMMIQATGTDMAVNGGVLGLVLWLGFVATTMMGEVLFAGKKAKLYLLDAGFHLVSMIIMGAVLAAWK